MSELNLDGVWSFSSFVGRAQARWPEMGLGGFTPRGEGVEELMVEAVFQWLGNPFGLRVECRENGAGIVLDDLRKYFARLGGDKAAPSSSVAIWAAVSAADDSTMIQYGHPLCKAGLAWD